MRHKFAVLIIFLVLLAACKPSGQPAGPVTTQIGTQGIVMNFLPNAPPPRVFDEAPENLQFLVEVKNRGVHALDSNQCNNPKILLQIGGYDETVVYLQQPPTACINLLEGKSQFNPDGGLEVVEWSAFDIVLPGEVYRPNFQVTSCYEYQTTATPGVCIDPRPRNIIPEKKACTVKDVALGGGQGAPVAVTKIEEEVLKDRVLFKIFVANTGGGDVISNDVSLGECLQSNLRIDAFNKVKIDAFIGGAPAAALDCNPRIIRLTNNQGFTICSVQFSALGITPYTQAFTSPLDIRLSYNYKAAIQKQVEIRKTP